MSNGWTSVQSSNEAWVLSAARHLGKVLSDPDHAYSDELDAEEDLMRAIQALTEEERQ